MALKKRIKKNLSEEIYKNNSVNDLILFAIFSLLNSDNECSFENLVEKCFFLFPKNFSFSNFPKWPDSRKLDRPLRYLRKGKMIVGNPKKSFNLTKGGRKRALEIANSFRQKKLL